MRDFFLKLFSENNSNMSITLFSFWHFFYLLLILGGALALYLIFRNKSEKTRNRVVNIFAYLTIGLYIADFFFMPLSDTFGFRMSEDKLPFHICTLMAVFVPFAQFNKKFEPIKKTIIILGITGSLMWMVYPGSALGGQPPFSYVVFQTFMYHGFLFIWGVLSMSLGKEKLNIKECWKEAVGIAIMFVWASFGNAVYDGHNWLFIKESIFPFISDSVIPFVSVASIYLVALAIYGMYYLITWLDKKLHFKKAPSQESAMDDKSSKEEKTK